MNWLVICAVLVFGVVAYRRHVRSPSASARRKTFAWAWAFWGAIIGLSFGVVGFGGAIAGTGVGALIGYLAASAWMKVDADDAPASSREIADPMQVQIRQAEQIRAETAALAAREANAQQADQRRAAIQAMATQEANSPIYSKIASVDEKRKSAMSELYSASTPRQRRNAAATVLKLDKQRSRLVRELR